MNMNANTDTAVTLRPSLLGLMLMFIGLALYLVLSPVHLLVGIPMLLLAGLSMFLTYQKNIKIGALAAACGTLVLHVVLLLTHHSDQWFPLLLLFAWIWRSSSFVSLCAARWTACTPSAIFCARRTSASPWWTSCPRCATCAPI